MTREEKVKVLKELSGEKLLEFYTDMSKHWNPIDGEFYENWKLTVTEILARLERGKEQ